MVEEVTMKTKVVYDDAKANRYLLVKEWDESKPRIAVISLLTGTSDAIIQAVTTACIINCVSRLGYGSVEITNLFSRVDTQIETGMDSGVYTDEENDRHIAESAGRATIVVLDGERQTQTI